MPDGFEMNIELKFELAILSLKKIRDSIDEYVSALEEAKKIKKQLDAMKHRFDNNEETFEDIMGFSVLADHAEQNQKQILEIQTRLNNMTTAMRDIL